MEEHFKLFEKYYPILEETRRKEKEGDLNTGGVRGIRGSLCCKDPDLVGSDQYCQNCGRVNMSFF